jgi:hypothetical protein
VKTSGSPGIDPLYFPLKRFQHEPESILQRRQLRITSDDELDFADMPESMAIHFTAQIRTRHVAQHEHRAPAVARASAHVAGGVRARSQDVALHELLLQQRHLRAVDDDGVEFNIHDQFLSLGTASSME